MSSRRTGARPSGSSPDLPRSEHGPRIFLVRHGTAEGADGVAVGHVDLPLSPAGAESLGRLAATWEGPVPDLLLSSDLARAADSADILASAWGLPVTRRDPRLREMDFGRWDGETFRDIRDNDPEVFGAWMERWWLEPAPEGESMVDVARRSRDWLDEILGLEGSPTVVAVAHGGSIRTLLGSLLDLPAERVFHLHLDHGRVSSLGTGRHGLQVYLVNSDRFPLRG